MNAEKIHVIRSAVRAKFAWPGGYPLFFVTADGGSLCAHCARKEWKLISRAIRFDHFDTQWRVTHAAVNWEDPELYCEHCSERIESAYAENAVE